MAAGHNADLYDEHYFRQRCGRPYERTEAWLEFFDNIAHSIVREIHPHTALDVGCAMGFLVEGLRARGVEAFGIDVSEYALSQVRPDLKPYCRLASITDPLPQRYDLVACIEVLEHLPPQVGDQAIANLCRAGDDILFSSTPSDYREATHFNVRPPEHWAQRFALEGFLRDVDFDATFITPWAIRFRRVEQPLHRVVRDYERHFWLLSKNNADLRQQLLAAERVERELRQQAAALERAAEEIHRARAWRLVQAWWRLRRALTPVRNRKREPGDSNTIRD